MALRAVRDSQGTWGTGGVVAELIAQAAEYTETTDQDHTNGSEA